MGLLLLLMLTFSSISSIAQDFYSVLDTNPSITSFDGYGSTNIERVSVDSKGVTIYWNYATSNGCWILLPKKFAIVVNGNTIWGDISGGGKKFGRTSMWQGGEYETKRYRLSYSIPRSSFSKSSSSVEIQLFDDINYNRLKFSFSTDYLFRPRKVEADESFRYNNYESAIEKYKSAEILDQMDAQAYMNLAQCYYKTNMRRNALSALDKAVNLSHSQEAYFQRGILKLELEDISAIEDLEKGGSKGRDIANEIKAEIKAQSNSQDSEPSGQNSGYKATGSGFAVSKAGYIVTNYHVVEDSKSIDVAINGDLNKIYPAEIIMSDKVNDIALIKISDSAFKSFGSIPYSINPRLVDVGSKCYALGYPMASVLGTEIKVTDGIISSRTGYQGDIVTYQISAAIQPGSSGGPLFDQNGNVIGITNAGVQSAQNVGYAIKTSYVNNLLELANITNHTQGTNSGVSFTEQVKRSAPFVVLILVK